MAQIAMVRQELVDQERWVSRDQFNRLLAVYQVLPGPEAHELCVHLGTLVGGRLGGFLAGLGFMLPGFLLMFVLSAVYVSGVQLPALQAISLGIQPAVVALIARAVHRIGQHAVTNRWLWLVAILAGLVHLLRTSFWVTLALSGLGYVLLVRRWYVLATGVALLLVAGVLFFSGVRLSSEGLRFEGPIVVGVAPPAHDPELGGGDALPTRTRPAASRLLLSGLRAGLLTFGGAYTAVPFLHHDAVEDGKWMTTSEFLDGVALSGILPAPFIIFSTFVGYLGGGPLGSVLLTVGVFLPAFSFALVGHRQLEQIVENKTVHTFVDGVTAGVVGLIAATTIGLFVVGVRSPAALLIFVLALGALYRFRAKAAVALVILGAGALGLLLFA